jgi:hypothetical protein
MGCETGQYEMVCKGEFGELHAKLDRMDEAIRGNGKPGLQRRLDRLEMAAAVRSRLAWLVAGSAVTLAATAVWKYVFAG